MMLYSIRYDYLDLGCLLDVVRDRRELRDSHLFIAHMKHQLAKRTQGGLTREKGRTHYQDSGEKESVNQLQVFTDQLISWLLTDHHRHLNQKIDSLEKTRDQLSI